MLPVLDAGSISGWAAAAQLVGDQHARRSPLLLQQLAEQAFGGLLIAPKSRYDPLNQSYPWSSQ
jgi:hypothetical protein